MPVFRFVNLRYLIFLICFLLSTSLSASPLSHLKMVYVSNHDGTFTYYFIIDNIGPALFTLVATSANYSIHGSYFAGGQLLDDDENLVLFGIDTLRDDLVITDITNADTVFTGAESNGFSDADNDGIPNQVASWHLPDVFTLAQTIAVGDKAGVFSFTLSKEATDFEFWVGGSDDIEITNPSHTMLVDFYGQYDLTIGEYLATFYTHRVRPIRLSGLGLIQFLTQ